MEPITVLSWYHKFIFSAYGKLIIIKLYPNKEQLQ
jgi:hypothetical protein